MIKILLVNLIEIYLKIILFHNMVFFSYYLVNPNIPVLVIGTYPYLLANGALIQSGEFTTSWGEDLRTFF